MHLKTKCTLRNVDGYYLASGHQPLITRQMKQVASGWILNEKTPVCLQLLERHFGGKVSQGFSDNP